MRPSARTAAIVDSTPAEQGPASSTASIRPSSVASTCSALVGLRKPLRLALGAASGAPTPSITARMTECAGQRKATVGSPALTAAASAASRRRGSTRVSGPGQCCAAKSLATGESSASRSA